MGESGTRTARLVTTAVVGAALVLGAAACSSSGSPKTTPTTSGPAKTTASSAPTGASSSAPATGSSATGTAPPGKYYVSIGDSYGAGYQPTAVGKGATTRNGFAYQLLPLVAKKGYNLTLQNFACAGATTESVLQQKGCDAKLLGPGATGYQTTQAQAAEAFLKAHRGDVALVTISIGGNDITACGASSNPVTCVTAALTKVETNLATLLAGLRTAAGPTTRFVGITYPDVLLGDELSKDSARKTTAGLSVVAFKSLINPGLLKTYTAAGASFVDVTAATGAYGSMTQTTTLPPYGTIPEPVAKICTLTYYCQFQDIHPRTNGYALIAGLIAGTLPQR